MEQKFAYHFLAGKKKILQTIYCSLSTMQICIAKLSRCPKDAHLDIIQPQPTFSDCCRTFSIGQKLRNVPKYWFLVYLRYTIALISRKRKNWFEMSFLSSEEWIPRNFSMPLPQEEHSRFSVESDYYWQRKVEKTVTFFFFNKSRIFVSGRYRRFSSKIVP